jgi:hypothetical protein
MTTSSQPQGFQAYNSSNSNIRPSAIKKPVLMTKIDESLVFGRIPYSSLRTKTGTVPSLPSSPGEIIKCTSMTQKRRSSVISLGSLLPRRKSLQTTALATRRQSLWMSIAKNSSPNEDVQPTLLPFRHDQTSLMRKKILRLLLVFSYLLSISLLAIALATFYGFFWSGYGTPQTTNVLDIRTTAVRSLASLTSNSTFVDSDSETQEVT